MSNKNRGQIAVFANIRKNCDLTPVFVPATKSPGAILNARSAARSNAGIQRLKSLQPGQKHAGLTIKSDSSGSVPFLNA